MLLLLSLPVSIAPVYATSNFIEFMEDNVHFRSRHTWAESFGIAFAFITLTLEEVQQMSIAIARNGSPFWVGECKWFGQFFRRFYSWELA
jgi:hypothetical protein